MAEGASQKGDSIVAQWPFPARGVVRSLAENELSPDSLFVGDNLQLFHGECRLRPRIRTPAAITANVNAANATLGLGTTVHRRTNGDVFTIVAEGISNGSVRRLENAGTWTDIGGGVVFAGSRDDSYRFTSLAFGTPLQNYTFLVRGNQAPYYWDPSLAGGNIVAVPGSPANWKDATTVFDRIIGITDTEVSWGEILQVDNWPAVNVKSLMETPDYCKAIRPFGNMNVIVFKERSIWKGLGNGEGTSAFSFRWQFAGYYEGPCGVNACDGTPLGYAYMTRNGRVGLYNGTKVDWIADQIWPLIRDDIDQTQVCRVFVRYREANHQVVCLYPRTGDGGRVRGILIIQLPQMESGVDKFACFNGSFEADVALLANAQVDIHCMGEFEKDAGGTAAVVAQLGMVGTRFSSGNGATIYGQWEDLTNPVSSGGQHSSLDWNVQAYRVTARLQPGLLTSPKSDPHRIEAVEPFLRRGTDVATAGVGGGAVDTCDVFPVASDTLHTRGGVVGNTGTTITDMDGTTPPVKETVGVSDTRVIGPHRGRFLGFRLDARSDNIALRYLGAIIYARQVT